MGEMTPALQSALRSERPLIFGALEINLPGYDLRLLDGSGEIMIAGNKFVGRDPTFGTIASVKSISDGNSDQAPTMAIALLPPSNTARTTLASSAMQGSRVRIWMGVVDMASGQVVPDPMVLFDGEIDVPTMNWAMRRREVEYRVVSVFEKFFDLEEGIRLSDSHHQAVWPGEKGLEYVTGVTESVFWGQETPQSSMVSSTTVAWRSQSK